MTKSALEIAKDVLSLADDKAKYYPEDVIPIAEEVIRLSEAVKEAWKILKDSQVRECGWEEEAEKWLEKYGEKWSWV